jgi:glycosyltransferase involved in cell wall biosynthesis
VRIIVVDDGSADDLGATLEPYGRRLTCIRHENNAGAAAARNTGVAAGSGNYVAFLDSDDVWLPGKLVGQIEFMRAGGFRASCTAYQLARPDRGDVVSPRYAIGGLTVADLAWGCFVSPGSTLMFERSAWLDNGPMDILLGRLEDWDWLLRYTRGAKLGFLSVPLARIDASRQAKPQAILTALARIREKHASTLSSADRRHFVAALELERAAVFFSQRNVATGAWSFLKSLSLAPIGHRSLRAILHNRFA